MIFADISNEEVNYFMKLSLLLSQLTQQQQILLAEILLLTSTSKDKDLNIFKNTRVPTSVKDFEDIFLSKSNAIIPNLPHPVISVTDTGGNAYISLIDLLANELADATLYDQFLFEKSIVDDTNSLLNNTEVTTISDTASARRLFWELHESLDNLETYTMYLWLKEGEMDFIQTLQNHQETKYG